jgi:hypothetical protein
MLDQTGVQVTITIKKVMPKPSWVLGKKFKVQKHFLNLIADTHTDEMLCEVKKKNRPDLQ